MGVELCEHLSPSAIGIDTIYRAIGQIPEQFLRGAGVPEPFIADMKALVAAMDPIQFYSCFISYSTKDQAFAERLHADLQAKGVRCWFAPHDVRAGKKLHEQIDEAIRVYDKLQLILSPQFRYSTGQDSSLQRGSTSSPLHNAYRQSCNKDEVSGESLG